MESSREDGVHRNGHHSLTRPKALIAPIDLRSPAGAKVDLRLHPIKMIRSHTLATAIVCTFSSSGGAQANPVQVPGLTLDQKDALFVPLRIAGEAIGAKVGFLDGSVTLDGEGIEGVTSLPDGTRIAPLRSLTSIGAKVSWDSSTRTATLTYGSYAVEVSSAPKRIVIDKSKQRLLAFQGDLLVFRSPISSGRAGYRTPNGHFAVGPYKAKMHYSSLYNGAPMPYSVQIEGNIFVHGYAKVPDVPASHGCIRLPLDGSARFFYEWADIGTPVTIEGRWQG